MHWLTSVRARCTASRASKWQPQPAHSRPVSRNQASATKVGMPRSWLMSSTQSLRPSERKYSRTEVKYGWPKLSNSTPGRASRLYHQTATASRSTQLEEALENGLLSPVPAAFPFELK